MTILEEIIQYKFKEVTERKALYPFKQLEKSVYFNAETFLLKKSLLLPAATGIIAEFKRKSPSKGIINKNASVEQTTLGYIKAGASALSVLTDEKYFGGSNDDLIKARRINACPILRKDFIVDEYQVIESKSVGADVILLIAACLTKEKIDKLAKFAKSVGLEILLELYDETEVEKISPIVDFIGINNRNLKNFEVNIEHSKQLSSLIPDNYLKIAESGINSAKTIHELKSAGFRGFLMGEYFMRTQQPEKACDEFIKQINAIIPQKEI